MAVAGRLIVAVCCTVGLSALAIAGAGAQGDPYRYFFRGWKISSHVAADGSFNHCVVLRTNPNNVTLLFGIDRNLSFNIGFSHPQWTLAPGANIPIELTFNNTGKLALDGTAIRPFHVFATIGPVFENIGRFLEAKSMSAASLGSTFVFDVSGIDLALPGALHCVVRALESAGQAQSRPQATPADEQRR